MQEALQPFRGLFLISFDLKIETSVWSPVADKEESEAGSVLVQNVVTHTLSD